VKRYAQIFIAILSVLLMLQWAFCAAFEFVVVGAWPVGFGSLVLAIFFAHMMTIQVNALKVSKTVKDDVPLQRCPPHSWVRDDKGGFECGLCSKVPG
jgi:hypothetical protein